MQDKNNFTIFQGALGEQREKDWQKIEQEIDQEEIEEMEQETEEEKAQEEIAEKEMDQRCPEMKLGLNEKEIKALALSEQLRVRAYRIFGLITATRYQESKEILKVRGGRQYEATQHFSKLYYEEVKILLGDAYPLLVVKDLVQIGVDYRWVNPYKGYSLLHLFILFLEVGTLEMLQVKGCNLDAEDVEGMTIVDCLATALYDNSLNWGPEKYPAILRTFQWLNARNANFHVDIFQNDESPFQLVFGFIEDSCKKYPTNILVYLDLFKIAAIFLHRTFGTTLVEKVTQEIFGEKQYLRFKGFKKILEGAEDAGIRNQSLRKPKNNGLDNEDSEEEVKKYITQLAETLLTLATTLRADVSSAAVREDNDEEPPFKRLKI